MDPSSEVSAGIGLLRGLSYAFRQASEGNTGGSGRVAEVDEESQHSHPLRIIPTKMTLKKLLSALTLPSRSSYFMRAGRGGSSEKVSKKDHSQVELDQSLVLIPLEIVLCVRAECQLLCDFWPSPGPRRRLHQEMMGNG